MIVLSVNAGSSSVKLAIFDIQDSGESLIAKGSIGGLRSATKSFSLKSESHNLDVQQELGKDVTDDAAAFDYFIQYLASHTEILGHRDDIGAVCHRVVHGGLFEQPLEINKETFHKMDELSDLAPLHNTGALEIVRACQKVLSNARNFAFFDSCFHLQSIPREIYTYPIDPKEAEKRGLRKYGFHGLSYAYVLDTVSQFLQKDKSKTTLIALHLGSGASACAIKNGKSLDTTMGLTPLEGLPGATRSGTLDPSLIFHLTSDASRLSTYSTKHVHITQAEDVLNKKSGWATLTGTTDFAEITQRAQNGDETANLAIDIFIDRIMNYLGSYWVKLGGADKIDALTFSGGLGEKGWLVRERVCKALGAVGVSVDLAKNKSPDSADQICDFSNSQSTARVLLVPTDEQTEMVREAKALGFV